MTWFKIGVGSTSDLVYARDRRGTRQRSARVKTDRRCSLSTRSGLRVRPQEMLRARHGNTGYRQHIPVRGMKYTEVSLQPSVSSLA